MCMSVCTQAYRISAAQLDSPRLRRASSSSPGKRIEYRRRCMLSWSFSDRLRRRPWLPRPKKSIHRNAVSAVQRRVLSSGTAIKWPCMAVPHGFTDISTLGLRVGAGAWLKCGKARDPSFPRMRLGALALRSRSWTRQKKPHLRRSQNRASAAPRSKQYCASVRHTYEHTHTGFVPRRK